MSAPKPDDDFFVGYINDWPGRLRQFLPVAAAVFVLCFAGVSLAIALTQNDPGPGRFRGDIKFQVMTGYLEEAPYPLLHVLPNKIYPDGRTVTLVGRGKRGAQGMAKGLNGQLVDVGGVIIRRGSIDMLVARGKVGIRKSEADPAVTATAGPPPDSVPLGKWRLSGEICDGKCYVGAMRPGRGIAHRACANFCIAGGSPPVFVSTDAVDGAEFFLLANKKGEPLSDALYDLVAVLISIEGEIERRGDLHVFKVDLSTAKAL